MNINIPYLRQVLSVQSKARDDTEMLNFLASEFYAVVEADTSDTAYDMNFDKYGNMYITKGEVADGAFYPAVVSHIDTVHDRVKALSTHRINYDDGTVVLYAMDLSQVRQVGIGGDDKCGVYVCLEMLKTLPAVKVVFFRDEETGCRGSSEADLQFFDDCAFVLQVDRQGGHDFIVRAKDEGLSSRRFLRAARPYMKRHSFKEDPTGFGTDVVKLKERGIGISVANISAGYYRPHGSQEHVVVNDLERSLNLVLDLSQNLSTRRWLHRKEEDWEKRGYFDKSVENGKYLQRSDPRWNRQRAKEYHDKYAKHGTGSGGTGSNYGYGHGNNNNWQDWPNRGQSWDTDYGRTKGTGSTGSTGNAGGTGGSGGNSFRPNTTPSATNPAASTPSASARDEYNSLQLNPFPHRKLRLTEYTPDGTKTFHYLPEGHECDAVSITKDGTRTYVYGTGKDAIRQTVKPQRPRHDPNREIVGVSRLTDVDKLGRATGPNSPAGATRPDGHMGATEAAPAVDTVGVEGEGKGKVVTLTGQTFLNNHAHLQCAFCESTRLYIQSSGGGYYCGGDCLRFISWDEVLELDPGIGHEMQEAALNEQALHDAGADLTDRAHLKLIDPEGPGTPEGAPDGVDDYSELAGWTV